MKIKYFFSAALAVAVALTACEGDKGDLGPAGPQGPQGPAGGNGTNGTNGTNGSNSLTRTTPEPRGTNCTYGGTKIEVGVDANKNGMLDDGEVIASQTKYVCNGAGAIYSDWTDINMSLLDWSGDHPAEEDNFDYKQVFAAPKLTADIVDKGVVLVYVKNSEGTVFALSGIHQLGVAEKYDMDGDGDKDYFTIHTGTTYKVGEIKLLSAVSRITDADGKEVMVSVLSLSGATVRYVLIPGVEPGRMADLSKMSYEQVAKLYNIK